MLCVLNKSEDASYERRLHDNTMFANGYGLSSASKDQKLSAAVRLGLSASVILDVHSLEPFLRRSNGGVLAEESPDCYLGLRLHLRNALIPIASCPDLTSPVPLQFTFMTP